MDQAAESEMTMMHRALNALYAQVPESVAREVQCIVLAAFGENARQTKEAREETDRMMMAKAEAIDESIKYRVQRDDARVENAELRKTLAAFNNDARGYLTKLEALRALLDRAEKALELGKSLFGSLDGNKPDDQISDDGATVWDGVVHEGERFADIARSTLEDIRKGKG